MGYQAPFPDQLGEVEYVQAYFHLELNEAVDLPDLALLQLRRELVQTLKLLSASEADFNPSGLQRLLTPALPSDPALVKQLQNLHLHLSCLPVLSEHVLCGPGSASFFPSFWLGPPSISCRISGPYSRPLERRVLLTTGGVLPSKRLKVKMLKAKRLCCG